MEMADWQDMDFIVATVWATAHDVLGESVQAGIRQSSPQTVKALRGEMESLVYALHRLGSVFPVAENLAQAAERGRFVATTR